MMPIKNFLNPYTALDPTENRRYVEHPAAAHIQRLIAEHAGEHVQHLICGAPGAGVSTLIPRLRLPSSARQMGVYHGSARHIFDPPDGHVLHVLPAFPDAQMQELIEKRLAVLDLTLAQMDDAVEVVRYSGGNPRLALYMLAGAFAYAAGNGHFFPTREEFTQARQDMRQVLLLRFDNDDLQFYVKNPRAPTDVRRRLFELGALCLRPGPELVVHPLLESAV